MIEDLKDLVRKRLLIKEGVTSNLIFKLRSTSVRKVMVNNLKNKNKQILIIGILLFLISIALIVFVSSQSNQSLEEEIASLEQNLSDSGYDWLVNQSINYTEVNASIITSQTSIGGFEGV